MGIRGIGEGRLNRALDPPVGEGEGVVPDRHERGQDLSYVRGPFTGRTELW